jgi:iron complex transport system substrate-binding protein
LRLKKTIRALVVASAVAALAQASFAAAMRQAATAPQTTARVVTDEVGHQVSLPAQVHRIVSIAPNLTETLYALGAESLLVADTVYCDFPPEAKLKPHVGVPLNPSLESIVALKPDLILATTAINRLSTVDSLQRLGLPVYSTDPRTVDGMLTGVERLAEAIGIGQPGEELMSALRARLQAVDAAVQHEPASRVLFVVWESPLISIGPKTFIADALRHAGAESVIKSKEDWPNVTPEEVVRLRPDYLVYAASHGDQTPSLELLRQRPGWKNLPAVKEGHLLVISDEIDRPAPDLVGAIEELAKKLHPAAFPTGAAMRMSSEPRNAEEKAN